MRQVNISDRRAQLRGGGGSGSWRVDHAHWRARQPSPHTYVWLYGGWEAQHVAERNVAGPFSLCVSGLLVMAFPLLSTRFGTELLRFSVNCARRVCHIV